MNTIKKNVPFSKISKETLQTIKNLRQEQNKDLLFCYSYDGDSEFLFYFFLSCFAAFPILFLIGDITINEMLLVVTITSVYLLSYWWCHYKEGTESCLFCDANYLAYFDFRGLVLYELLDQDRDTTIKKITHVQSSGHEGLVIRFLTGEVVKIYAEKNLERYVPALQTLQFCDKSSILSNTTLEKAKRGGFSINAYDVLYLCVLMYFVF